LKKIAIILFLTNPVILLHAQKVNFEWANQAGGTGVVDARGLSIITDASGNIYTTGFFNGQVDFDPGPGVYNLNPSDSIDLYVSKLDSSGKFVWAKQLSGINGAIAARGKAITLDAVGNAFITGDFLDVTGNWNCFVSKLDASGNFFWTKQLGRTSNGTSIKIDDSGNIYTAGLFSGESDFDPGPGTFNLFSGTSALFLSKLDANGDFVWAKGVSGYNSGAGIYGQVTDGITIALDGSQNIFISGSFVGTVDFDPGTAFYHITADDNSGSRDIFILKLDESGNFNWVKQIGGIENDYVVSTAVNSSGEVYIAGNFSGTADFDPGSATYNLVAGTGIANTFISKLDNNGNFIWAKQLVGNMQWCYSMALDNTGNLYTTGYFGGTLDIDPGTGTYNLSTPGYEIFISKLNGDGNLIWAKQIGGTATIISNSIVPDMLGNVYTTGYFLSGEIDFDPGPGNYNLTSGDGDQIFALKLSSCKNNTYSDITANSCKNYILNGQAYSSTGVYKQALTNAAGCDSIITLNLTINILHETYNITSCKNFTWNNHLYSTSGTYTDTLITTNGCDSIVTLNLTITVPLLTTVTQSICTGESANGHTVSGTYVDTLIAINGCDSIVTLQLTVLPKPSPYLGADALLCIGDSLRLSPGKFTNYTWQDGSVQDHFIVKKSGLYAVTVTNNCGSATDEIAITEEHCNIYFPTVFTPNNDGKNELFKILGVNNLAAYHLLIYNRWGQKVFETFDPSKGWNGSFNGKTPALETFIWYCELKKQGETNIIKKKGTVILIK
jgi:gliding motility-associated-like protein